MTIAAWVSIVLFVSGVTIGYFKWLHGVVVTFKEAVTKFDIRTEFLVSRMDKVEKAMMTLARADERLGHIENQTSDHEARIRTIESKRNYE